MKNLDPEPNVFLQEASDEFPVPSPPYEIKFWFRLVRLRLLRTLSIDNEDCLAESADCFHPFLMVRVVGQKSQTLTGPT